jgi:hypothetical protein
MDQFILAVGVVVPTTIGRMPTASIRSAEGSHGNVHMDRNKNNHRAERVTSDYLCIESVVCAKSIFHLPSPSDTHIDGLGDHEFIAETREPSP